MVIDMRTSGIAGEDMVVTMVIMEVIIEILMEEIGMVVMEAMATILKIKIGGTNSKKIMVKTEWTQFMSNSLRN